MTQTIKHTRKLNAGQLEVLRLLYKFRFGSNDLFAQYFGKKDRSFVYKRMSTLVGCGLIGKRFESSYRLRGKPAAYYLLPAGARLLQEYKPDKPMNIKLIYKDKDVSEDFVDYCLEIFSLNCRLKARYGDSLTFLTKSQLAHYDYFEDFTPAAYMRLQAQDTAGEYFLEYVQSSKPFFTILRRIKQYIDYADEGEWEAATDSDFPRVLLVCDSPSLQKRLIKRSASILSEADDELEFYIADKDAEVWRNLAEPDEVLSLDQI